MHKNRKKCGFRRRQAGLANFPRDGGVSRCVEDIIKNIQIQERQQSCWKGAFFQIGIISRTPPLPPPQSTNDSSINFLALGILQQGWGEKLVDALLRPVGLISMPRKGGSPLKSQLLSHMTGGRRGEICSLKPIKRPEFYLFCFKGRRQRGPQGLLQDGSEA